MALPSNPEAPVIRTFLDMTWKKSRNIWICITVMVIPPKTDLLMSKYRTFRKMIFLLFNLIDIIFWGKKTASMV